MSNKQEKGSKSGDRKFKEIRRELNKKQMQKKGLNIIHEYYVDSSRMISVELGGEGDLKNQMHDSMKKWGAEYGHGEHHDYNVVKLAEYYMKKGLYKSAISVLQEILQSTHPSTASKVCLSRCHLMMGNWAYAVESAEVVLHEDRQNIRAIFVKAEAKFNLCEFEHSLVLFHRGLVLAPDMDDFRLGVQKCQKTIDDGVGNAGIFQMEGLDMLFRMLTVAAETKDSRLPGPGESSEQKSFKMGFANLTSFIGEGLNKPEITHPDYESAKPSRRLADIALETKIELPKTPKTPKTPKPRITKVDRLLEDKVYLKSLANGIGIRPDVRIDRTNRCVRATASQALDFLRARESFWDQLDLGQEHRQAKASSLKAVKSYRWIM